MALPININDLIHGKTIEWERVELKEGWNPEAILHTLCAFANDINHWDGGYVVIGVAERNGKAVLPPIGLELEELDSIQKKLIEFSNRISPSYTPIFQPCEVNGKWILVIWAPGGDHRPYQAPVSLSERKSERASYIRKGSTTTKVKSSSEDERRLLQLAARIPFDDRIHQQARLKDLDLLHIQAFLHEVDSDLYDESRELSFAELCRAMKIAKGPDELLRPTNAGVLMFSDRPDELIPGARIEIVTHRNEEGRDFKEKIFTGPIHRQLKEALQFINSTVIVEHVVKLDDRPEATRFFNFPFRAIEEALANAVYHKSYELANPVEVQIFPDRMVILSFPGPVPPIDNKMLQKSRVIARDYRNRRIGEFLKELDLTEGRGTGLPMIHQALENNGSPKLQIETDEDRNYFLLTIWVKELPEKARVVVSKDLRKEPCKDLRKDLDKDLRKDLDKDLRKEPCKDLRKEPCKDLRKESDKDLRKESDKDLRKESDKDLRKEPCKDLRKEPGKDLRKDLDKDLRKDLDKDLRKESDKDLRKDLGKDLRKEPGKDLRKEQEKKLTKNQELIIRAIQKNNRITQKELSVFIGINAKNIRNNILKLKELGFIERIGPNKGGSWKVTENVG